jgi:acetyl-CoA synthetase
MAYPYQITSLTNIEQPIKKHRNTGRIWAEVAQQFVWRKSWDSVLEWNFTEPKIEWFKGARQHYRELR